MARRFAKVSEEEIEEAFFYPSDLLNTIPLRGQGRWRAVDIYLDASRLGIYPPLFTSLSGDSCILLFFFFYNNNNNSKKKMGFISSIEGNRNTKMCKLYFANLEIQN